MPVAYSLRGVVELVVETNNMSAKMLELWPGFKVKGLLAAKDPCRRAGAKARNLRVRRLVQVQRLL
jgi:hypothetical protein